MEAAAHACDTCEALERLVLHGSSQRCRITLVGRVNTECQCTALRWTALVTKEDRMCASGEGHTQDEAVFEALKTLGLVQ